MTDYGTKRIYVSKANYPTYQSLDDYQVLLENHFKIKITSKSEIMFYLMKLGMDTLVECPTQNKQQNYGNNITQETTIKRFTSKLPAIDEYYHSGINGKSISQAIKDGDISPEEGARSLAGAKMMYINALKDRVIGARIISEVDHLMDTKNSTESKLIPKRYYNKMIKAISKEVSRPPHKPIKPSVIEINGIIHNEDDFEEVKLDDR